MYMYTYTNILILFVIRTIMIYHYDSYDEYDFSISSQLISIVYLISY